MLEAKAGATIRAMAKDADLNGATNGSSSNGFSPDVFIDEADRLEVEAQHAAFRELGEEFEAEGVDGTAVYEQLLADFGISSA